MLKIQLLGEFRLEYNGALVTTVDKQRLQSLLAYLLIHRAAPQSRQRVAFLLWPDSSEAQARTNLRNLLYLLRDALPDSDCFLSSDGQNLQWRPDAPFWLDVAEFEKAIEEQDSLECLEQAVKLYQGELLPGCYEEWLLPERQRLEREFITALEGLIALLEGREEYGRAVAFAEWLRAQDPLREDAYRKQMHLLGLMGDRAEVVRVYQACEDVLKRELGPDVGPSTETHQAYEQAMRAYPPILPLESGPHTPAWPQGPHERISCPYPGLVPFNLDAASFFFGREKETDELFGRLSAQSYLLVIGPSGCGKSSLVFAGLVTRLRKQQPDKWAIFEMRPGADPTKAEIRCVDDKAPWGTFEEFSPDTALVEFSPSQRVLLIIDQFEELFAQTCKSKQARFIAALESLRSGGNCTLILTMRADFYPDLMSSDLWPVDSSERVEIAPLRGSSLAEALYKPAEKVGVYLEPSLLQRLLADAADEPGALPLLQETMVLLWGKMERRLLTLRSYQEVGQADLSGLAVALATRATAALAELDEKQRTIARRIFLRLVQFGEGRADTRRQQPVAALRSSTDDPVLFHETLCHLTETRLLTLTADDQDPTSKADLAHEALINGWPMFKRWLAEHHEAEQTRRRLEDKGAEWARFGRGKSGLLDEDELREAEDWFRSPDAAELGEDQALRELVQTSREAIEEAKRLREQEQRERVEAQEAARREAEQRAESERKAHILLRRYTIILAILLFATVVIGVQLYLAQGVSRSRELAASAVSQLSVDPELSILLALEAAKASHTEQAEGALRQSLLESHVRVTLRVPSQRIDTAAFSPDGRFVVTAGDDNTARVWETATGKTVDELRGHARPVRDAAFSSDGRFVVTAGEDSTARIWEASTGKELAILRGHTGIVNSAAFSPGGKLVATASDDQTARLWNASTGDCVAVLQGHTGVVETVGFSPDSRLVFTLSGDKTVRVWDTDSGALVAELRGHTEPINRAAISPDGKLLATASDDGTARIWQVSTGQSVLELSGHTGGVNGAAFSPDGRFVVTASDDKTARVWETATGRVVAELRGHTRPVRDAAFSPNGRFVVTASDDSTARVWEASTGKLFAVLLGHTAAVDTAAFRADGMSVLTKSADGSARIWEILEGKALLGHSEGIASAEFSPDGSFVVTGSDDSTAMIWETSTGKLLNTLLGHTDRIRQVAVSPNGKLVATASNDRTARIWEVGTGKLVAELRGNQGAVFEVAFSPDGKLVVTVGEDHTARAWEVGTGKQLAEYDGGPAVIYRAAFSPDGKYVTIASDDRTAQVWETEMWKPVIKLHGHTAGVTNALFSPDGKYLVTTSFDGTARVYETNTWKLLNMLPGHTGFITEASLSRDGRLFVTASTDHTARVWNVATGSLVSELRGHTDIISSVGFSPDDKLVITGGMDPTVRIWEASTGRLLNTLWGHTDNVSKVAFSPDGKYMLTASADGTARIYPASNCEICGSIDDLIVLASKRVTRTLTADECQEYLHEQTCPPGP